MKALYLLTIAAVIFIFSFSSCQQEIDDLPTRTDTTITVIWDSAQLIREVDYNYYNEVTGLLYDFDKTYYSYDTLNKTITVATDTIPGSNAYFVTKYLYDNNGYLIGMKDMDSNTPGNSIDIIYDSAHVLSKIICNEPNAFFTQVDFVKTILPNGYRLVNKDPFWSSYPGIDVFWSSTFDNSNKLITNTNRYTNYPEYQDSLVYDATGAVARQYRTVYLFKAGSTSLLPDSNYTWVEYDFMMRDLKNSAYADFYKKLYKGIENIPSSTLVFMISQPDKDNNYYAAQYSPRIVQSLRYAYLPTSYTYDSIQAHLQYGIFNNNIIYDARNRLQSFKMYDLVFNDTLYSTKVNINYYK